MKKIGVIGSGAVGKVLASGFIKHGYDVMIGSSDASKLSDWKTKEPTGKVGSMLDAAEFGDIIILAVKGSAAENIVISIAPKCKGKTIIDTTNPIADAPPVNGVLNYFTSVNDSLMERLQGQAPDLNFVKSFNSVGNAVMVNPNFPNGKPTMFICGNSDHAKNEVKEILDLFGWEVCDCGKMEAARPIESLCVLWCIPGFLRNEWKNAFKFEAMS